MKRIIQLGLALMGIFGASALSQAQNITFIPDLTPTAALPAPSMFAPPPALSPVMIRPVAKPAPCAKQYEPFDVDDY
ncbi:MAG TPA: hypothetical protein VE783_08960, partial [Candidatus Limnocylindrales bacterium]|nr:hypothetical protein [Candidatus Limnocylindrales bacterium]